MKIGCVAICLDSDKNVLMFLKRINGQTKWSLPMAYQKDEESLSNCSLRGVKESTGLYVELVDKLYKKTNYLDDETIKSHYYEVKVIAKDNKFSLADTEKVEWVNVDQLKIEEFFNPEDKYLIKSYIKKKIKEDYKRNNEEFKEKISDGTKRSSSKSV